MAVCISAQKEIRPVRWARLPGSPAWRIMVDPGHRSGSVSVIHNPVAMDLVGMNHRPETESCTHRLPPDPSPEGWRFAEKSEIPVAVGPTMNPAGGPLSQPGILGLPFRVGPEPGLTGPNNLSDRPDLNLRGAGAYHVDGLPGARTIDPGNLSFCRKSHSFQSHPNR